MLALELHNNAMHCTKTPIYISLPTR